MGTDATIVTPKEWTPLMIAAAKGYTVLVDMLMQYNAFVDASNENG